MKSETGAIIPESGSYPANKAKVKKGDLASYSGNCYLGIDSGSTTTKAKML